MAQATLLPMDAYAAAGVSSEFEDDSHRGRSKGTHGGRRAGSGRKPLPPHLKKQRRKQFEEQNKQIRLKRDLIAELESWGESHGMKRTNYSEIISFGMKIIRKAEGTHSKSPLSLSSKSVSPVSSKASPRGKRKTRYCGEDDDYIYDDESDSDYDDLKNESKKLKKGEKSDNLLNSPPHCLNGNPITSPTLQEIDDMGLSEDKKLLLETILKLRKDMWSEGKQDGSTNPLLLMQSNQDALHMRRNSQQSNSEQDIQETEEVELEIVQEPIEVEQEQQDLPKGQSSHKEE